MSAEKSLAIYLNDHLSGAAAGLELLEHLRAMQADDVSDVARVLHGEVLEDRRELESLMQRLGVSQSPVRQASAWLAEKFTRLKLRLDDPSAGAFYLFESLEALSLGIEGKRLLWVSLSTVATTAAAYRLADYDRLIRRAEDQRARVEQLRRSLAQSALVAPSDGDARPAR